MGGGGEGREEEGDGYMERGAKTISRGNRWREQEIKTDSTISYMVLHQ